MDIKKSSGSKLIPEKSPPKEFVPEYVFSDTEALDDIPRRIIRWTVALGRSFFRETMWRHIPGYRYVAYGFADPEIEKDAFGVIVYAHPIPGIEDQKLSLAVGGVEFPIFVRRSIEVNHALPYVQPLTGTAGCWATSSKLPANRNTGLLTAKHILPAQRIGSPVDTTHGYGRVLDLGPDGIDAALVETPQTVSPNPRNQIKTGTHLWPWMDVVFEGRSGKVMTKVVHVTDTRGTLTPYLPARLILAVPGQQGDSGALIVNQHTDDGVGIYCGILMDPAGRIEGFAQHLAQATDAMGLTLYD